MKLHFIAIGGSVMHNLALALHDLGHLVTGSDDEIYEPAKGRLQEKGLLPAAIGWDSGRISPDLDGVILGMHAKADNPELVKARELGLKVWSFPEFIHHHSRNKQRIVIAGSHGKTTITSMILHVLKGLGRKFDYLAGGQVQGFDKMVGLSEDAPIIVMEGDEYLASPLDRRPKFLVYQPHIALISGIAWDHINVFPTERDYIAQFEQLVSHMPKAGAIIYNDEDKELRGIIKRFAKHEEHYLHPYATPDFKIRDHAFELRLKGGSAIMSVIGRHNMANIAGAWEVCRLLAIELEDFLKQIATFKGAARRLERIHDEGGKVIFKDFAHSPSKVKATVEAVVELYGKKEVIACLELHTFSSLNKQFLGQYKKTLKGLKHKIVYVDAHTLQMKNLPAISRAEIVDAFGDDEIVFATDTAALKAALAKASGNGGKVFLMMSSGTFGGQDLKTLCLG